MHLLLYVLKSQTIIVASALVVTGSFFVEIQRLFMGKFIIQAARAKEQGMILGSIPAVFQTVISQGILLGVRCSCAILLK